MKHFPLHCFCLVVAFTVQGVLAQTSADQTNSTTNETTSAAIVAHVYAATPTGVELYDTASNGKLSLVAGSPFPGDFSDIVTNGAYFYGTDGTSIYEDTVSPSGALKRVEVFNPALHADEFESVGALDLDHAGSALYVNIHANGGMIYESYRISKANGSLVWLGDANNGEASRFGVGPLHITANDKFVFQTQNYFTWFLQGFAIGSNRELVAGIAGGTPPAAPSSNVYNPYALTADPSNHLAVAVYQQEDPPVGPTVGPTQLAVYTTDGSGGQTTASTYENMPDVALGWVSDMNMSPSGKLLAVAGNGATSPGLQVFHFNGANPITHYTGVLTTAPIDQVHWDNSSHLFAISKSAGKLFVFTVTPTSVSQAPGSPYSIDSPQRIAIRPL